MSDGRFLHGHLGFGIPVVVQRESIGCANQDARLDLVILFEQFELSGQHLFGTFVLDGGQSVLDEVVHQFGGLDQEVVVALLDTFLKEFVLLVSVELSDELVNLVLEGDTTFLTV